MFVIKSLNISKRYLHKYPGGKLPGRQSEGAAGSIWKGEGKTKTKQILGNKRQKEIDVKANNIFAWIVQYLGKISLKEKKMISIEANQ